MEDKWYGFSEQAIQNNVPHSPGVYRIATSHSEVYVGQSTDLQHRLLEHVRGESDQSACIKRNGATIFLYAIRYDQGNRSDLEEEWITRYKPICNG